MRQVFGLILLASLVGGCATVEHASPSAPSPAVGSSIPSSPGPSASEISRRPLPSGFPVLQGAIAVALPADDPGLVGLWASDTLGSAAYDFYVTALPAAGYPIVGLYPGGAVALIRFEAGDEVWQMVAHAGADGGMRIEIRLDRP